jgi:hypothetical protein
MMILRLAVILPATLISIVPILPARESTPPPPPSAYTVPRTDASIKQLLVGRWQGEQKGFRGTLVYQGDGTCTSHLAPYSFLMRLVAGPYHFTGKWWIEKARLHTRVTTSSTQAIVPGTHYINEILHLDKRHFITKNEKGWITTFRRLPLP